MPRLHRVHETADIAADARAPRGVDAARPRALRPAAALLTVGLLLTGCAGTDGGQTENGQGASASATQDGGSGKGDAGAAASTRGQTSEAQGQAEESASEDPADFPASNTTTLTHVETIKDPSLSSKSVVSNQHGLVIANNMMYRHNVMLLDTRSREVVQTLEDTVDTDTMGIDGLSGVVSGSPVEAAWTQDGQYAYVTNYQLTGGVGTGTKPDDNCTAGSAIAPSLVYRYSVKDKKWDAAYRVGRVPKYVALSPDDSRLLVANWCDATLSVLDTGSGETEHTIPLDTMPRGTVVLPDNKTAYVTAMWADKLFRVDLEAGTAEVVLHTGPQPRHLTLSPDGKTLYMTVAGADQIVKLDAATGTVLATASAGDEPRSMDISADGTALYVVNYEASTVTKIDAETLEILDTKPAGENTVGVTYDKPTGQVWVANYGGTLDVYDDTDGVGPGAGGSAQPSTDTAGN
ncbi:cytochrome D1 domain-containing protein [Micrococcaceae bacterium Sec6.3]